MNILLMTGERYETPGLIPELLGADLTVARLADGFPDTRGFDGVIVLASTEELADEWVARVRWSVNNGQPYLGFETGALLLARAADGSCERVGESYGWGELVLTPEGAQDAFLSSLAAAPAMHLLARYQCEGFFSRFGDALKVTSRAYGIFGRLEATPELLDQWIAWAPQLRSLDAEAMRRAFTEHAPASRAALRSLLEHFARLC